MRRLPSTYQDDTPLAWQTDARCAETDPEMFFPEKGGSTAAAKKICSGCEVAPECLQYAIDNEEQSGIWGGLSERQITAVRLGKAPNPFTGQIAA
ncbi:WhiB family transcriptional regulator [Agromyces sp. NPDC057679]|uniref:WhiB family transcriptional regulator n=1 Tax=Agromyces sp. NPDC057679 TaxID=3346207 RepID=UPI0036707EB3